MLAFRDSFLFLEAPHPSHLSTVGEFLREHRVHDHVSDGRPSPSSRDSFAKAPKRPAIASWSGTFKLVIIGTGEKFYFRENDF